MKRTDTRADRVRALKFRTERLLEQEVMSRAEVEFVLGETRAVSMVVMRELKRAIAKYGDHVSGCLAWNDAYGSCTCGWSVWEAASKRES